MTTIIIQKVRTISFLILAGLMTGCSASTALVKVPIPATGAANHPLRSHHELQYLSCDFRSGKNTQPLPEILDLEASSVFNQGPKHLEAASKAWLYALLASNVYREPSEVYEVPGWKVVSRSESTSGLALEEWAHESSDGRTDEIVVAFEGTKFSSLADWKTNLSLIEPRQNREAYQYMRDVVRRANGARIITTGHSLGGALALNMSLRFPNIQFRGFDSSPRGFYKITRRKYDPSPDRLFIYEKGEVLSFVRVFWFNRLRKFDERYWFNFMDFLGPSAFVSEHSMYRISRGLLMTAIKRGDAAAGRAFTANFSQINLQTVFPEDTPDTMGDKRHNIEQCQWIFRKYPN